MPNATIKVRFLESFWRGRAMSFATMWLLKFGYALSFVALWMAGYICIKKSYSIIRKELGGGR
jgi:hypothetical protein